MRQVNLPRVRLPDRFMPFSRRNYIQLYQGRCVALDPLLTQPVLSDS